MKARVLPPEEWAKLNGHYSESMLSLAPESDTRMVVCEDDAGNIVGSLGVMRMPQLEGFWLDEAHKGNAGIIRALLREAMPIAVEWANGYVLVGVTEENMRSIVRRMEGVEIPAEFFLLKAN